MAADNDNDDLMMPFLYYSVHDCLRADLPSLWDAGSLSYLSFDWA
jgi:hypothetical protein